MKNYSLKNILGNDDAKEYFTSRLKFGNLGHAYILSGQDGCGRRTLALNVIAAAACENENAPCGECDNCKRILSDTCVDVYTVKKPSDRVYIPIAAIRSIYDSVYLVPNDLSFKAYIIEGGELMQPAAQNALLKLLEEPPSSVIFFIITTDPAALLPTILSRAFTVPVKPLPDHTVKAELLKRYSCTESKAEKVTQTANGSLGLAISLMAEKTAVDKPTADAVKLLDKLCSEQGKFEFISMHHTLFKKSAEMFEAYEKLLFALRDIALYKSDISTDRMFFSDLCDCEKYADILSTADLLSAVSVLNKALSMSKTATRQQLTATEYSIRLWNSVHNAN